MRQHFLKLDQGCSKVTCPFQITDVAFRSVNHRMQVGPHLGQHLPVRLPFAMPSRAISHTEVLKWSLLTNHNYHTASSLHLGEWESNMKNI